MLKIAITGASGLIGSRIIELLHDKFTFIPISIEQMDITNKTQVNEVISAIDFDFFLHLAGYTNVDGAELNKKLVWKINVDGTSNVFTAVQKQKKKFIYVSTDFVFDGKTPPFTEVSTPNPLSYYAKTKYEGEKIVSDQTMIIRLSYPYRKYFPDKLDFVRSIKSMLQQNKPLTMVKDAMITPTFIDDIAYGIEYLINHYTPEIFHLIGSDSLSPFQAAQSIASAFQLNKNLIKPISFSEYSINKALRPQYSTILSRKNNFYRMKSFKEGLALL